MLRVFVLLLVAANLGFWAWRNGWLDAAVGLPAHGDRDPARMARQLRPEVVQLARADASGARAPTPAAAAATSPPALPGASPGASAPASRPAATGACLEAGPFSPAALVAAEAALVRAALPAGSWADLSTDKPGAWIVYMGRYPDAAQLAEKEEQLRRFPGLAFERVRGLPDLEPGLSLGRFDDRARADAALARLVERGVRSARVITVAAPSTTHMLRVEHADAVLEARLVALKAPALGAGFVRCARASPASSPR